MTRGRPGGEPGGLQRGGASERREEPGAGHRGETARLQAGAQRLGPRGVLAGTGREVQDHFRAGARQPQCHHDDGVGRQHHALEPEAEKLRAAQIAWP